MKKTILALLSVLVLLGTFASCDKHKTYAEKLSDEKKAIDRYIRAKGINVISFDEFLKNDTVTDLSKNEYVQLQTGLYLQIVNRGSELKTDTFKHRDEITVRFEEYDIKNKWFTAASNTTQGNFVDSFVYTNNGTSAKGEFVGRGNLWQIYGSKVVPIGWIIPLRFIRQNAHVKLIVSSKLGHNIAMQEVAPYAYDLKNLSLSKH